MPHVASAWPPHSSLLVLCKEDLEAPLYLLLDLPPPWRRISKNFRMVNLVGLEKLGRTGDQIQTYRKALFIPPEVKSL